jgi:hypothetical protein
VQSVSDHLDAIETALAGFSERIST